ncbi:MAG: pyridoxamine 5'-phosphate oxidase family protein [Gammaproteobacteria bacterium]|nr:pyridoxamine 5'-phosphate oxidase family protein [Gammaproteobacteria bacterium]
MPALTPEEFNTLMQSPTIARLAMTKPNGAPYVVPIWQHWDGQSAYVIPRGKAKFMAYIEANSRVALSIADDVNASHDRVLLEGVAHIEQGPAPMTNKMLRLAEEMAERYGGDEGLVYLKNTLAHPRYLVRIEPEAITTWKGAWHPRYA